MRKGDKRGEKEKGRKDDRRGRREDESLIE